MPQMKITLPHPVINKIKELAAIRGVPPAAHVSHLIMSLKELNVQALTPKADGRLKQKPKREYKLGDPVYINTDYGKIRMIFALNKETGARSAVEIYKTQEQPEIYSISETEN